MHDEEREMNFLHRCLHFIASIRPILNEYQGIISP